MLISYPSRFSILITLRTKNLPASTKYPPHLYVSIDANQCRSLIKPKTIVGLQKFYCPKSQTKTHRVSHKLALLATVQYCTVRIELQEKNVLCLNFSSDQSECVVRICTSATWSLSCSTLRELFCYFQWQI